MTPEEAIKTMMAFKAFTTYPSGKFATRNAEAFDMAISALEKQIADDNHDNVDYSDTLPCGCCACCGCSCNEDWSEEEEE